MTDLVSLGADVSWPDSDAAAAVGKAIAGRGLGRLGELAEWLAGAQATNPPHDFARVRALVFGCSAPSALAESAADLAGLSVQAVPGTDGQSVPDAVAAGAALADREVDSGTDLAVVAHPGETVAAAVLVCVLTDSEPVKVLPRGTQLDPQAWMELAEQVRDTRRRAYPLREQPLDLLAAVGGPDLAMTVGFLLRAAVRRTPVVIDGVAALAAALVAYEAQPRAVRWWRAADRWPDAAHERALTTLGIKPILDLGLRSGDGTAGLLAVPLLRAAARAAG